MRRILEIVSLAALGILWAITWLSFHGQSPLPASIPTHFNAAGQPDAWGPPSALYLLPAVALGLYLLISLLSRLPVSFRSSARITEQGRQQIETITRTMVASLKAELTVLFATIQGFILQGIQTGHAGLPPLLVPAFLAVLFATLIAYIVAMLRAAWAMR
jgi:uncharacterized membrane protein